MCSRDNHCVITSKLIIRFKQRMDVFIGLDHYDRIYITRLKCLPFAQLENMSDGDVSAE